VLDVLSFRTGDLAPTATYRRRAFCWVPADRDVPEADRRLGNLTLRVEHRGRRYFRVRGIRPAGDEPFTYRAGPPARVEVDTYAVSEDETPEPGDHGGRAFWLFNQTDPDAEEAYRCVVGGLTPKCRCLAGQCKVPEPCKHLAGLTLLVESGILDGLDDDEPGGRHQDAPGERTAPELQAV
jgi:hypothetical protein